MRHVNFALLAALLTCAVAATALAQGRGFRGGRGPGRGGHGPDKDFVVDRDDFHFLLGHHDEIRRVVKELKDGVETVTESDDKDVAARIQKHVAAMYERVEHQRPIRMRDPLFAELFRHADKIKMELENIPQGVRVVETSDDEYVAKLIKSHAKVVSGFAKHGFEEAHKTHSIPGNPDKGGGPLPSHEEMADIVFVEFDRLFIPALALTNQMKHVPAAQALQRLSKAWDARFVEHFHQMFDDDSKWPLDVSRIAQALALAEAELQSGEAKKAHETLEPVRDILVNARSRNEFDYPLDTLSQFHATMEAIVKPARQMKVGTLTDSQIMRFLELARQASQKWEQVEQAKFDLAIFAKNEQQQSQFPSLLRAERNAIDQLVETLAKRDEEAILKAATGLKPPFAKVYMFFGDFPLRASTAR
jgi:hypothetical protein